MSHWRDREPKTPHPLNCVYCQANLPHESATTALDCTRLGIANPMQLPARDTKGQANEV